MYTKCITVSRTLLSNGVKKIKPCGEKYWRASLLKDVAYLEKVVGEICLRGCPGLIYFLSFSSLIGL
jgi:hypothetical protein